MAQSFSVHYVGTDAEADPHALPLRGALRVEVTPPERVMEVARPGDVALFFTEHFERFRRAIGALRRRGIATLYAIDGILEWRNAWENRADEPACPWTMRPVLCHKVACVGRHQARILRSWGNGPKVEIVGLPRLDRWLTSRSDSAVSDKPLVPTERATPCRILVVTAKFPGFTPEQIETTRQSLHDLAAWFRRNPQLAGRPLEITWRLTHGLDRMVGVPNSLQDLSGAEIAAQIQQADVVICTASTVMLESMLLRRPTVLLDYHAYPTYVPAAWTIRHAGDIDSILTSAAAADPRRMSYQEFILGEELECATPALPRLVQLIEQLHATSLQASDARRETATCEADFEPDPDVRTTGQLAAWFPTHFSGLEPSLLEAAAELAHTRREIENLHRCIAQLSGELASAHDIFRQIHAHPIAGPVVRTRQRLLDLVQHWSGQRGDSNGKRS